MSVVEWFCARCRLSYVLGSLRSWAKLCRKDGILTKMPVPLKVFKFVGPRYLTGAQLWWAVASYIPLRKLRERWQRERWIINLKYRPHTFVYWSNLYILYQSLIVTSMQDVHIRGVMLVCLHMDINVWCYIFSIPIKTFTFGRKIPRHVRCHRLSLYVLHPKKKLISFNIHANLFHI